MARTATRGRGGGGGGFMGGRDDGGRGGRGGGGGLRARGGVGMKRSSGGGRGSGGRGGDLGGGGGRGRMKAGGSNIVVVEPHKHEGVFIVKGQEEDALCTKNLVPGDAVYNEERVSVQNEDGSKVVEYRVWNPFRSKIAAAILGGVDNIWIKPGARVLYLGDASGTTISDISDIVGPQGVVYAVEFSSISVDLVTRAMKRKNIIPITADARCPGHYTRRVGMVDVIFSDYDVQSDQVRILASNASYYLKARGHFVLSIKANCIDSTAPAEAVFAQVVKQLQAHQFIPAEQVSLEPFERDHAFIIGGYRMPKKSNNM